MPIIRITAPNQPDRLQKLDEGVHQFGSNFDADLVLIDDGILPKHFTLKVTADGVSIMMADGATGRLVHRDGAIEDLTSGQECVWRAGQHLEIANLIVEIGGANLIVSTFGKTTLRNKISSNQRGVAVFSMASLLALLIIGNGSAGLGMIFEPTPEVLKSVANPEDQGVLQTVPATPPLTVETVRNILMSAGFTPDHVELGRDGLEAFFYHSSTKSREALAAFLAEQQLPVRTHDYLQSQILSAVNIILQSATSDVRLENIVGGNVSLVGLRGDAKAREAIAATIRADVVGVQSVKFIDNIKDDAAGVAEEITAVWTGEYPYVVLFGGSLVRPGQTLRENIDLEKVIAADRILVRTNGTVEEVIIQ
jgi:hypothetical protein